MYYKVYFTLDSQYNHTVTMEVEPDTKFAQLIFKFCEKIQKSADNLSFEYNSKKLDKNAWKSLKEIGISNGAEIKVCSLANNVVNVPNLNKVNYFNVFFIYENKQFTIQADSKMKFSELTNKFYFKAQIKEGIKPIFIFNSKRISEDESKTLEKLEIHDQSKIDALLINQVIAGIYL